MHRAFVAFLLLGCAAPKSLPDRIRIDGELRAERVAPDAWVVTQEPFFSSNVLVVRLGDGTVVIASSPYETEGARALVRWIRTTLRPSRMIAFNTHFHFDGTGGNQAFAEAGVETWSTQRTRALLEEKGARVREKAAALFPDPKLRARVEALKIVPAANTFDEKLGYVFERAGETVQVFFPGPAHSPDNVVVHFPSRRLLFGGCMVKPGSSLGYLGDADLAHWEESLARVMRLEPHIVVPGHGPVGGPELLRNTVELVRAARR